MDFLNKRLRDEISALRKSIDSIRDEYKRQNEDRENYSPQPVVVQAELQVPEAAERDHAARDDRAHRQQVWLTVGTWLTFLATACAFGAAAYYARIAALQLETSNSTLDEVVKQTKLLRQEVVGTMAAVITSNRAPEITNGLRTVIVEVFNSGHVVSTHLHVRVERIKMSLPKLKPISHHVDTFEVPQLAPGDEWYHAFVLPSPLPFNFEENGETLTIQGAVNFDNGFGERFDQSFCFTYIGRADIARPEGNEGIGRSFLACDLVKDNLQRWIQNKIQY